MTSKTLGDINIFDIGTTRQLVGGIWQGHGENLLTCFPDETLKGFEPVELQLDTPAWERFLRQSDLLEVEILKKDTNGFVKSVVRKSQRMIDANLSWQRYQLDGYKCRYCGRTGIPLSVDHIILWENGGATILENLLSSCKPCNRLRGNTPYEVWIVSTEYKQRSENLDDLTKQMNLDIVLKLEQLALLKVNHIRSR